MSSAALPGITFGVASYGDGALLRENFLSSPCFEGTHPHQILVRANFPSAAKAYNEIIDQAANDLIVFAHYDVLLPASWLRELRQAIEYLDRADPAWGVLGCYGVNQSGRVFGFLYQRGMGLVGTPLEHPEPVQTLDEFILVIRKSSGLRFDERLPHFHLYGADICLRAASRKLTSYTIPAFCVHNTNHYLVLPPEFYECCRFIRRVWRDRLPVQTSCIRITRFNLPVYQRRLMDAYLRYVRRKAFISARVKDSPKLMNEAEAALRRRLASISS